MNIEYKFEPGEIIYVPVEVKAIKHFVEKDKDGVKCVQQYILKPNDCTETSDLQKFSMNGAVVDERAITQHEVFKIKALREAYRIRPSRQNDKEINCNSCDHVDDNEGVYCYECSKDIQNNYTPKDSSK